MTEILARLAQLEADSRANALRLRAVEGELCRAKARIAVLSGESLPLVAGGSHGVDDGEHLSFSEWRERKTSREQEDF